MDWQACHREVSHGTPLNAWREEHISTLKRGDVAGIPYVTFCDHYNTAPQPARPSSPKDKNLIEVSRGVFCRWVRPKINRENFNSLGELNVFIREKVIEFNARVRRKTGISRSEAFENGEKEKLLSLPDSGFEFGEWKKVKVHPDCHIQSQYNFYSIPHKFVGQELDLRAS